MSLPVMPSTHTWVQGGPVLEKAGRNTLYASDAEVVWVWDEDTGLQVQDLRDATGATISVVPIVNGWVAGVGVPNAVVLPSFSVGQNGSHYPALPVQTIRNAASALGPADTTIAGKVSTPGSATDTALKGRYAIAATVTAAGALGTGKHTPVDATSGALTVTLPASPTAGEHLSVEKVDATANAVTVSGSLRGSASTITLVLQHETLELLADGAGSWWPVAGHKTKGSLDALYAARWQSNTAYLAGQAVVNPSGDLVTAKVSFTSGASYSATNWNLSASYAPAMGSTSYAPATGSTVYAPQQVSGQGIARVVNRADYATLAAALTAAGANGTVTYPFGSNYNEAATTISAPVTIDSQRATITKSANGALLTITSSGVRISKGVTVYGNAPTYTGPGVVVTGNGSTQDLRLDGDIVGCDQWCVDFGIGAGQRTVVGNGLFTTYNKTAADAVMTAGSAVLTSATAGFTAADVGKYALIQGAYSAAQPTWYLLAQIITFTSSTSVTLDRNANVTVSAAALEFHYPTMRFGAEYGAGVTGDRHILGTHTSGYLLADVGGAQTLSIIGTNSRGVVFSSASCAKVSFSGANRLATSGAPTILHGINHNMVGATIAADLILETDCTNSAVAGNVGPGTGGAVLINKNNTNMIATGRPDSKLPQSIDPAGLSATAALAANQAVFLRASGSGWISKIGLHVGVSSGNVCVGVYSNTGHGSAAAPAAQTATSGSVACPAAGYQEIALTAPVWCAEGDWLSIVADNATATFYRGSTAGFNSALAKGRSAYQNSAFPLPATTGALTNTTVFSVILLGID